MTKTEHVWAALTDMYGSKFISAYGDKPLQMWAQIIENIPQYKIERGLRKLLVKGSGTPPTLPQFNAACVYTDEDDQAPIQPSHQIEEKQYDGVHRHSQRVMLNYLLTRNVNDKHLPKMVEVKNAIANDFRSLFNEGENPTGTELWKALDNAFDRVIKQG